MNIGWYMNGDMNTASSRIMGYQVHNWFNEHNINSTILQFPEIDLTLDAIIFQKIIDNRITDIIKIYKEHNIKTYYILDDLYTEAIPALQVIDVALFGSEYIQDYFKSYIKKSYVLLDAYETPRHLRKLCYTPTEPLTAIWIGTLLHFPQAEEIRPLVESIGYKYITISATSKATKLWDLKTVWADWMDADVMLIPFLGELPEYELAKGNNRITQSMILCVPVIASPIPAYISIVRQGKNGFICFNNTKEEFAMYLELLKNYSLRFRISEQARKDVIDRYSIETIGKTWKEILNAT